MDDDLFDSIRVDKQKGRDVFLRSFSVEIF